MDHREEGGKSLYNNWTVSGNRVTSIDANSIINRDARNINIIEKLHKHCHSVKIIALRSAGYSGSSIEIAKKYGIEVCRVPSYSPHAVAEHSLALLLSLNRSMHHAFFRTKQHNFTLDGLVGTDVFGKTVGIIGTGGVGMCAVDIFLGFGCKVLCYDIKPDEEAAKIKAFEYVTMDELLQKISLYAPLNKSTYHLIDKAAFDKMKQGAMLINTSRGPLVDTNALLECLKSKKLRGAALDVYEFEEKYFFNDFSQTVMDDDTLARLISMPNTIVTSHQAFLTEEALKKIAESIVQSLLDFFHEQKEKT
ncbi:unnamed protein product [Rotaria sp. Silwood2]|nr:unnamed protein product [Rotaria sp. Silwood2]CAF3206944.1 unnamed protein product [Rotaria sp. Silwood2]CAF4326734.1 unnamed protein product [Rotaria sp. Silwood2]CAF4611654.1 unnamed protein product [Rotaria sp. Silwood2]CAF4744265.1 unnamed protein product [Rotaria sp. Silwood2]